MSNHKAGREPENTSIVAVVTRVVPHGHNGAHAFAKCEERPDLGEISFSIETDPTKVEEILWKDAKKPRQGDYVRLDDIRRHRPSRNARQKRKPRVVYRAYEARIERLET